MKTKSRKHGFRRLLCGLTAFATAALMLPMSAMAVVNPETDIDAGTKTITVTAEDGADGIQEAIDYLTTNQYFDGWTVSVEAGNYNAFDISQDFSNLTVSGTNRSSVVVETLTEVVTEGGRDSGGINAFGNNVTIENMTITAGNVQQPSFSAAISAHDGAVGGADISLNVRNCTITGSGIGDGILFDCPSFSVVNCDISNFYQAIEFYGDNFTVGSVEVTGNIISNSSFAFHGYFGKPDGNPGTIEFSGNTITGTDSRRSKIVIQDNSGNDPAAYSMKVNIHDNNLTNALIGLVMLDQPGEIVTPVLANNTFGQSSFYVEAIYPGTIDLFTTFRAPENTKGYWVTYLTEADVGAEALAYIQSQIDTANQSHSTTLSITGIDPDNLIETFTLFKDGIYWVTDNTPDPIDPALDKTSNYAQVIGEVAPDAVVPFEVALLAPQTGDVIVADEMTGMYFNRDSLSVWVNGSRFYDYALDSNYVSFTLTLHGLTIGDRVTLSYSGTVTGNPGDRLVNAVEVENKSDYVTGTVVQPTTGDDNDYTLSIRKEWVGDDPSDRPDSITLNIYKDGELYDELEMSGRRFGDSDTWRESYPIPARYEEADWWVEEADVPAYYDSSVEETRDNVFVITNTYDEPEVVIEESSEPSEPAPEPSQPSEYIPPESSEPSVEPSEPVSEPSEPSEPTLPQTGQLWWPVPVLLLCGAVAVASGALRSARRNRK